MGFYPRHVALCDVVVDISADTFAPATLQVCEVLAPHLDKVRSDRLVIHLSSVV